MPYSQWEVVSRIIDKDPSSNNGLESGNAKLNAKVPSSKPSMVKFLEAMREAEDDARLVYERHLLKPQESIRGRKHHATDRERADKIHETVVLYHLEDQHSDQEILVFLKQIRHLRGPYFRSAGLDLEPAAREMNEREDDEEEVSELLLRVFGTEETSLDLSMVSIWGLLFGELPLIYRLFRR